MPWLQAGGCTHISAYLLKIEPGTAFGRNPPPGLPDADAAAEFYLYAVQRLAQEGYRQYEISNFACPATKGGTICCIGTVKITGALSGGPQLPGQCAPLLAQ